MDNLEGKPIEIGVSNLVNEKILLSKRNRGA